MGFEEDNPTRGRAERGVACVHPLGGVEEGWKRGFVTEGVVVKDGNKVRRSSSSEGTGGGRLGAVKHTLRSESRL